MEETWESLHLHSELDSVDIGVDDFLKEILFDTPQNLFSSESESDYSFPNQNGSVNENVNAVVKIVGNMVKSNNSTSIVSKEQERGCLNNDLKRVISNSPKRYILSFDNSTMIQERDEQEQQCLNLSGNKREKSEMNEIEEKRVKKSRNGSQCIDHIMAERKRRQDLMQRFIALSATIPGLSKTDKASILRAAIDYVKQLQERVHALEKQDKNIVATSLKVLNEPNLGGIDSEDKNCGESETCFGDDCDKNNNMLPEIEVRVMGKEVLIEIHCEKQNGIELKLLKHLENLQLFVNGCSVLPFGKLTIFITIIAKMDDGYKLLVNDLVKSLRQVLLKPK